MRDKPFEQITLAEVEPCGDSREIVPAARQLPEHHPRADNVRPGPVVGENRDEVAVQRLAWRALTGHCRRFELDQHVLAELLVGFEQQIVRIAEIVAQQAMADPGLPADLAPGCALGTQPGEAVDRRGDKVCPAHYRRSPAAARRCLLPRWAGHVHADRLAARWPRR
nr:hypothetical protein [Novosphingobium sp. NDB2Meth1]